MKSLLKRIFSGTPTEATLQAQTGVQEASQGTNNRFLAAVQRVQDSPYYRPYIDSRTPYGYYHNRPVIGENTKICGGIYLSPFPAEALVVDEKYDMLRPVLSSFRVRFGGLQEHSFELELTILEEIFSLADKAFVWSPELVYSFNQVNNIAPDSKVALDVYIRERVGTSRHRVLLAAYLAERLKEDGYLTGILTITGPMTTSDRNDEKLVYTFRNGSFATYDPRPDADDTLIHSAA